MPLVGARTRERLAEALGALDAAPDADDLAAIERARARRTPPPATAIRSAQMAVLDSERA